MFGVNVVKLVCGNTKTLELPADFPVDVGRKAFSRQSVCADRTATADVEGKKD